MSLFLSAASTLAGPICPFASVPVNTAAATLANKNAIILETIFIDLFGKL
jgi:hypothetical protein